MWYILVSEIRYHLSSASKLWEVEQSIYGSDVSGESLLLLALREYLYVGLVYQVQCRARPTSNAKSDIEWQHCQSMAECCKNSAQCLPLRLGIGRLKINRLHSFVLRSIP